MTDDLPLCPGCKEAVSPRAAMCPKCHRQLSRQIKCRECGKWIGYDSRTCPECGVPINGAVKFIDGITKGKKILFAVALLLILGLVAWGIFTPKPPPSGTYSFWEEVDRQRKRDESFFDQLLPFIVPSLLILLIILFAFSERWRKNKRKNTE